MLLPKLQCLNLITFHCPTALYKYLQEYVRVIGRILEMSLQGQVSGRVVEVALQGLNEIAATKYHLLPKELINFVIHYQPTLPDGREVPKIWTNLMIDFIENDDGESFAGQLPTVIPRAIQGLQFTQAD